MRHQHDLAQRQARDDGIGQGERLAAGLDLDTISTVSSPATVPASSSNRPASIAAATSDALPGWLFRVAVRWARRSRRMQLPFQLDALIGSVREPSAAQDTDALLDRLILGDLLRLLTERQRGVVIAHYYLGLTQQEIAAALGIRRGTVGATLSQALKQLRKGGSYVV